MKKAQPGHRALLGVKLHADRPAEPHDRGETIGLVGAPAPHDGIIVRPADVAVRIVRVRQRSRLERGATTRPEILQVCCAARVLGLRASVKLYPWLPRCATPGNYACSSGFLPCSALP